MDHNKFRSHGSSQLLECTKTHTCIGVHTQAQTCVYECFTIYTYPGYTSKIFFGNHDQLVFGVRNLGLISAASLLAMAVSTQG